MKFALSLFLSLGLVHGSMATWNYEGRYYWPSQTNYAACGGRRQSPINIDTENVFQEELVTAFSPSAWDTSLGVTIQNTGNHITLTPTTPLTAMSTPTLSAGPSVSGAYLGTLYVFADVTFYVGSEADRGSGHTIDGQGFAMEADIRFFKISYGTLAAAETGAATDDEAFLTVSILFTETTSDNTDHSALVTAMGSVGASGSTTTMTFQLSSLLPPSSNPGFYFYEGSRQFPACSESYLVMVIEDSETMSKTQLDAFRNCASALGGKMADHTRQTMPVNNRIVRRFRKSLT